MSSFDEKKDVARQLGAFEDDGGPGKRPDTETIDVPVSLDPDDGENGDEDDGPVSVDNF